MDTNDSAKKNGPNKALKEESITGEIEKKEIVELSENRSYFVTPEKEEASLLTETTLTAQVADYANLIAHLKVKYSWNQTGTLFTCTALEYKVADSGGDKGNVILGFGSVDEWPAREISNDNAIQDNKWHSINGGGSVIGNSRKATIYFKYIFDHSFSDPWASIAKDFPFIPSPPTIGEPAEETTHLSNIVVRGTCISGATVRVQASDGTPLSGSLTMSGAIWTFTFPWTPGTKHIKAVQIISGAPSPASAVRQFYIKPPAPEITEPAEKTTHPASYLVTGTCMGGATVAIQNSNGSPFPEVTVYVDGTTWYFNYPWMPGTKHIKAVQTVNGQKSAASAVREFYIKPPNPEITEPAEETTHPANVRVTGTCMEGATVAIQNSNGSPFPEVTVYVNRATWYFDYPWMPGTKHIKAVQTVNGQTSAASALRVFNIKPPAPEIIEPAEKTTHPANVRVTGTCMEGATVAIQNSNGTPFPEVPVYVNRATWYFDYPWMPGTKHIKAVQTVNEQKSAASDLRVFYITPPAPEIIEPAEETTHPANVRVTGTCMEGATVAIQNSDGSPLPNVTVSVNGATWHFDYPWTPGTKHIKAVQTVNEQTSAASALRVFNIKPPAPEIIEPEERTTHPANVRVTGTCMEGATVAIQNSDGSPLPNVTVSVNGATWHFDYPWTPGTKLIKAVQTVNGQTSAASDLRMFYIRQVESPKPEITNPGIVWKPLPVITGTGEPTAIVTLKSPLTILVYGTAYVKGDRSWSATLTRPLPMTEQFTLSGSQRLDNVDSGPANNVIFAVLFKPEITEITVSADGKPTVKGTGGLKDARVEIWLQGGDGGVKLQTSVLSDGSWSVNATTAWPIKKHIITARQIGKITGKESDWADHKEFKVKPLTPAITPPPNPAAARQPLIITNVSAGTVTLEMFDQSGTKIPGNFTGSGTTYTFIPSADWPTGSNTVYVVVTVDGIDSDPSDNCTFFVGAEKPEAPQFELPLEGSKTSSRPLIRVNGLPLAQITVRLEGAETLHSDTADADGVLEFKVEKPLTPGTNGLEVKQKSDGPESDWSEFHRFTVKETPKTPEIEAPRAGSLNPRKLTIRGKGETGGQILLRHEKDPENLIDTLDSLSNWRWTAEEPWDRGEYTIQAQRTVEGDSSEWTEPRTFKVVDARYGIGDAGPVLSQPVAGTGQSVLLRVQVNSGDTGEPAEGVKVEWRIKGEQHVIATTETGPDGWGHLLYTPHAPGTFEVLADITPDNQGVVMTESFEVTALLQDDWAQEAELYLNEELVDLAKGDLVLLTYKANELELRVKSNSVLIGSSVTLQDLWGATETGLKSAPDLGVPQTVEEGKTLRWSISFERAKGGYFGLKLTSPALPDWHLPSQAETGGFANDLYVDFDNFTKTFGGDPAHPCLGATHVLTVRPTPYSRLLYKHVRLELSPEAAGLGVTISTESFRVLGENGVFWTLNCANSSQKGNFAVRLKVQEWDLSSRDLPMSLGHNKVEIAETSGPTQSEGGYWTYGIKAVSSFTKQPAGGVPVTVVIAGEKSTAQYTNENGWLFVRYNDGLSAKVSIFNPYDRSTVEPS